MIFIYGSLLDPAWLRRKAGDPTLQLSPAILPGCHRTPRKRSLYPTLKRGGSVAGAVVKVSARALGKLSAYEGDEYRIKHVTVMVDHKARRARVWID